MELNREKIKNELTRLGWTESELARHLIMHRQQLNKLLKPGSPGMTLQTIDRIADALGLDAKDLIK